MTKPEDPECPTVSPADARRYASLDNRGDEAVSPTRRRQLSAEYEQSVNQYILRLERENAQLRASLDQKDRDLADCSRRLRGRP
jgi:hypothetical protein